MKHTIKIAIACIAFSSPFALITPSASAADDCFARGECTWTFINAFQATETWMAEGEELADDEEYVPGYEEQGPLICMAPDEELGEGYESANCVASTQRGFILVSRVAAGKRRQRKKKKASDCRPTLTIEYGLDTSRRGDYAERVRSGCGQKYVNGWPTTTRCGPPSADPDCQ